MPKVVGTRALLLGPALTERDGDTTLDSLDVYLEAISGLLPQVYGADNPASQQAQYEFGCFREMPRDFDGVLCKRAALLFAMAREKELASCVAERERLAGGEGPTYSEDLRDRVLPFITPRFIRNSCQTPDTFVVLACVLAEMWPGEPLGNWPLGGSREEEQGV
jgi:hypothetical protein